MKKVSWDDQGQVPWSLSYANTGNTYGFRRKCKTDDKIGRKNAARLLKENGLHFSLKSFFVKKTTTDQLTYSKHFRPVPGTHLDSFGIVCVW